MKLMMIFKLKCTVFKRESHHLRKNFHKYKIIVKINLEKIIIIKKQQINMLIIFYFLFLLH